MSESVKPATVSNPTALRRVGWYVLFILLVVAGDRLLGGVLKQLTEQSMLRYSRLYTNRAAADVLLVGNSRGLTFFQPYIEEKTGLKTFNLSYNGMPMDLARALAEDYIDRYPKPTVMLVDITTCDRENKELLTAFLSYSTYSHRLDTLLKSRTYEAWRGAKVSALYRYNNEVFQRALFHRRKPDTNWLLDRVINTQLAINMEAYSYPLEVHPYLVQHLAALVKYAQARQIDVQLVISPYYPGFHNHVSNLDALKTAVEQATGLPVHDYRQALTDPSDFGDFMHPNKKGSFKYIDLMASDSLFRQH